MTRCVCRVLDSVAAAHSSEIYTHFRTTFIPITRKPSSTLRYLVLVVKIDSSFQS